MFNLEETVKEMSMMQAAVCNEIMATPTSEARNALCDVNIHLMSAMERLLDYRVQLSKENR